MTEHYKNFSLENIVEEINGIVYTEEWRDVVGYEWLYQISNFGRVKRFKRNNCNNQHKSDLIMSQKISKKGYLGITFRENGKAKSYRVNRLVAINFIPNENNKPEVNHKNGIKIENNVSNLEWSTASENQLHSFHVLGKKPIVHWLGKFGKDHHASIDVYCKELNLLFHGVAEAARYFNVSSGYISMVYKGKRNTVKGYKLNYK